MKYNEQDISLNNASVILFTNTLRQIIQNEVQSFIQAQNIEFFIDLSVVSVSDNGFTAKLKDLSTNEIYENIPNNTGIVLNAGDIVRMYYGDGKQYIGQTFANTRHSLYENTQSDKTDKK